jgi:uncharacterized membrane protein YuzA (DUF378 family)
MSGWRCRWRGCSPCLQLNLDLDKIMGGLLLGAMAIRGAIGGRARGGQQLSFPAQFLLGGLVLGLLSVLVWTASRRAASRIRQPEVDHTAGSVLSRTVVPWRTLLLSLFGVPVVAQLLGSMAMMEAQISTMLAVSGLVAIAWLLQTRANARVASPQTAAATAAVATSRPIGPTGRLDQRVSRHAESLGVLVSASPSPVLSRPS